MTCGKSEGRSVDHLSILKNFLDGENRLKAFPSKRKLKLCAVRYLAEKFEPLFMVGSSL